MFILAISGVISLPFIVIGTILYKYMKYRRDYPEVRPEEIPFMDMLFY